MGKRLRRQRAQAFHGYLQLLESDFNRVAAALRLILAQSSYDRPELASALLHRRLTFVCRVMEVQVRLALFRIGWDGVDGTELIRLFDGMRLELRNLVPQSSMVHGLSRGGRPHRAAPNCVFLRALLPLPRAANIVVRMQVRTISLPRGLPHPPGPTRRR